MAPMVPIYAGLRRMWTHEETHQTSRFAMLSQGSSNEQNHHYLDRDVCILLSDTLDLKSYKLLARSLCQQTSS